jgi:hypothetical protein
MKVLISLVSDQTIPNVHLIKNMPGARYLFLTTPEMQKKNITGNIKKALNLPDEQAEDILIPSEDPEGIWQTLDNAGFDFEKDEYILNITGGNKLMMLIAYNYFVSKSCKIYYLPIGKMDYLPLHPQDSAPLKVLSMLSLEEYLHSYGTEIIYRGRCFRSFKENEHFKENLFDKYHKLISRLVDWQRGKEAKKMEKNKTACSVDSGKFGEIDKDELKNFFKDCGINSNSVKNYDVRYVTGNWFEEYIYQLIRPYLKANEVALNVNIQKVQPDEQPYRYVDNELDVVYIRENKLHVIECKTSVTDTIMTATFYKQRSIGSNLGLRASMTLVTLRKLSKDNLHRAKLLDINLIGGDELMKHLEAEDVRRLFNL